MVASWQQLLPKDKVIFGIKSSEIVVSWTKFFMEKLLSGFIYTSYILSRYMYCVALLVCIY